MLFLNTSTAPAISPISSLRPRPGIAILNSPPASPVMADTIEASAFEIERPISSDRPDTRTTESANAISIHVLTESRVAASACFGFLVEPLDAFCDFDHQGFKPAKRLHHVGVVLCNLPGGLGPGRELLLIGCQFRGDLGHDRRSDRHRGQRLRKFRAGFLYLRDIFLVAPQHEVLLVPAHHQHPAGQTRIVDLLEFGFDIMDGAAQRAGQPQRFVQAQFDFRSHHACEIEGIFLEAVMRELDLIEKRAEIAGPGQRLQPGKIAVNGDHQFGMGFRIGFIAALLKVLFVAPRLEHLDRDLLVEIEDRPGVVRNRTRGILRPASNLIDRTEGEEPDQADNADCHDPVGETDGKATHAGFLMS